MFRTLTAGILAVTLSFSSATSTQAQGLSEDDVGKILFGILATAVIANAVKNNRDDDRAHRAPRHVQPQAEVRRDQPHTHLRNRDHDRHAERRSNQRVLPRDCLRRVETHRGTKTFMPRRCLNRKYARAANLPQRCAIRINTHRGQRSGFDPRCLRDRGYSLSRR